LPRQRLIALGFGKLRATYLVRRVTIKRHVLVCRLGLTKNGCPGRCGFIDDRVMTQARRQLVDSTQAQMFRCIQRCVRLLALGKTDATSPARRQGRFSAQALHSEKALMAALTYIDLNPIRADIATSVSTSRFTSVKVRAKTLRKHPAGERIRIKSAQSRKLESHLGHWLWARLMRLRSPHAIGESLAKSKT
jgi:hypothetical protein